MRAGTQGATTSGGRERGTGQWRRARRVHELPYLMAEELINDAEDLIWRQRPRDIVQLLKLVTGFDTATIHLGVHDLPPSASMQPW